MSAAFERIAPRAEGSVAFQEGNAPAAASMAREVSPSPDFGVVPKVSEGFAGLTISETSPESAGTHSPPIKFFDSIWDSITIDTSLLLEEWLALAGHFFARFHPRCWSRRNLYVPILYRRITRDHLVPQGRNPTISGCGGGASTRRPPTSAPLPGPRRHRAGLPRRGRVPARACGSPAQVGGPPACGVRSPRPAPACRSARC